MASLHEKDETTSTNDDAKDLAERGAPMGEAVLARRQTRGRGRAGRAFVSPEGGLYLSVVLRPRRPPDEWGLVPLLAGVVVAHELRRDGYDARLKWPNDILLSGKKLGGVLVESRWGEAPFAVVGIGLNVEGVPDVTDATSLASWQARARPPPARALAERLVTALVERTLRWAEQCLGAHARPSDQALFGIVQGGTDPALRERCTRRLVELNFPANNRSIIDGIPHVAVTDPGQEIERSRIVRVNQA